MYLQQTTYTLIITGFNLDRASYSQQQYRTAACLNKQRQQPQDKHSVCGGGKRAQHISGCAQELQNSSYFNHEPVAVMKYSLHNSSAPLGRNKIFTNSAYIDHLFHDVNKDIAIANCDQYTQIINPSENDAYNTLATICHKDSTKKARLELQLQKRLQEAATQPQTAPAPETNTLTSTATDTESIASAETMTTTASSTQTMPEHDDVSTFSSDSEDSLSVSIESPNRVVARRQRRSASHA